jgi:hypothetical protein
MSQKYHITRSITNDLYCAAYLLCQGCTLQELLHNGRSRVSFVLSGDNIEHLRAAYDNGETVRLNVRSFRDNLLRVRRRMDTEQRSVYNAHHHRTAAVLKVSSLQDAT